MSRLSYNHENCDSAGQNGNPTKTAPMRGRFRIYHKLEISKVFYSTVAGCVVVYADLKILSLKPYNALEICTL